MIEDDPSFKRPTNSYSITSLDELIKISAESNDTLTSLGNFAGINANIKEPVYQLRSIGALMRSIYVIWCKFAHSHKY